MTEEYKGKDSNSNNIKRLKDIQLKLKLEKNYKFKTFFSYHDALFNQRIYGTYMSETKDKSEQAERNFDLLNVPLNQILYGPPGTGKTFRLQKEYFDKFTIKETSLTREQFLETKVADLTWWQVISIAVLDIGKAKVNDIFNHEFIRLKEKLSSSKTVRPTIWGQLQSHTIMDCQYVNVSNRSEPLFFNKNEN
ncbi:hypothetical protein SAMN05444396_11163 [Flavobacterium segetis]|uniref:Uncharacterized protein n=1 Tax=Flavobacterium segetis TaxID=271157 RepID=A0A1M5JKC4_9FLAO|nr:hypothetical protein [Flavobacterium segetis]SHG41012.1 hypothetical protein SAMN05444396_11163 [Flavobacterium segetis]